MRHSGMRVFVGIGVFVLGAVIGNLIGFALLYLVTLADGPTLLWGVTFMALPAEMLIGGVVAVHLWLKHEKPVAPGA